MLPVLALLSIASATGVPVPVDEEVTLRLEVAAQARVDLAAAEEGTSLHPRMARMRPMLHLETRSGDVRGFLHGQVWFDEVEVLDVFFDARTVGEWRARVGLMKVPFTQYRLRAWFSLPMSDWALTSRALGAERQIGGQVSGPVGPFAMTFGVFGGQNERASHAIKLADLYAVPTGSRLVLSAEAPTEPRLHPELFVQVIRATDGLQLREGRERTGTGAWEAAAVLSLTADLRPEIGRDYAGRAAIEGIVQGRGLGLTVAGIGSLARSETSLLPGLSGALAEGAFRVGPRFELAGRAAVVHAPTALRDHARVSRRYRGIDGGDLPWVRQSELGVAWNTFLPNPNRMVTIEATWLGDRHEGSKSGQLVLRAQLNLVL